MQKLTVVDAFYFAQYRRSINRIDRGRAMVQYLLSKKRTALRRIQELGDLENNG